MLLIIFFDPLSLKTGSAGDHVSITLISTPLFSFPLTTATEGTQGEPSDSSGYPGYLERDG